MADYLFNYVLDYEDMEYRLGGPYDSADLVPEERWDDLLDALYEMGCKKEHEYSVSAFKEWFLDSAYVDEIDEILYNALDEWISDHIREAVRIVMDSE